ncbi:hypothetical protein CWB99_03105 [Pseudoalteromonas rubra]|uniref:Uncharacterized protein n=1 Tax=Pseudoalteromonas rubra TaxID=43658 RepID=A0A5S3WS16_9GAMM|nr:hypothetical protein [Pseudoalteromonas rubra]TMP30168.1 hypothetical protein CWC00_17380 [Pseudoalteromonas rubra]TMP31964.1 hypothetical protein CWB99_03105 [Pseudoalteromonas rubra]
MLQRLIGYVLFIPFITFYSYVLGPALKVVLVPGGLAILFLILGPEAFFHHWRKAKSNTEATIKESIQPG